MHHTTPPPPRSHDTDWRITVAADLVHAGSMTAITCRLEIDPLRLLALTLHTTTIALAPSQARTLAELITDARSGTVVGLTAEKCLVTHLNCVPGGKLVRPGAGGDGDLVALDTLDTEHPVALLLARTDANELAHGLLEGCSTLDGLDWRTIHPPQVSASHGDHETT
ncbi:hypothetical protein [Actinoalloteichus caeruleus]|uniref:hypothetical protein n=1 Tax=Actinoalloteichus cyanogriseus TaxID=2893586 RepID=UPI0004AA8C4A|nr:hypothetical protein [Actinoalloteichus caeruleus]